MGAFVLGNVAASDTSSPKSWVAIVDIVAAVILLLGSCGSGGRIVAVLTLSLLRKGIAGLTS